MREATKYINNPFHHTLSTQLYSSYSILILIPSWNSILKTILFVKENN